MMARVCSLCGRQAMKNSDICAVCDQDEPHYTLSEPSRGARALPEQLGSESVEGYERRDPKHSRYHELWAEWGDRERKREKGE